MPVTVENMREQNAPRNVWVIDTLRRFHLAEDAGMGIDLIQDQMSEQMLEPPDFEDDGTSVTVRLPLARTVTSDEYAWVVRAAQDRTLNREDRVLLVAAARGQLLTNKVARALLHADSVDARASLQRLCQMGLLTQVGQRSGARYRLADSLPTLDSRRPASDADFHAVILELVASGPVTNADVRGATGLDRADTLRLLQGMVDEGLLGRSGTKRGTRYQLPDNA